MIGQMGSFSRPSADISEPLDLYLHGYVSSRLMKLPTSSSSSSSPSADDDNNAAGAGSPGVPVCISASQVDGIVVALSAFNHSYNYRSAVLFGHAAAVTDPDERLYAMELITNSVVPDRWRHTRLPVLPAELQSTGLIRVSVSSGSYKARTGNASDDRHDLDDRQLVEASWTGVLPVHQVVAEPVPSSYCGAAGVLPDHLREFSADFNAESREQSISAANK